jgi:hypothetical protein
MNDEEGNRSFLFGTAWYSLVPNNQSWLIAIFGEMCPAWSVINIDQLLVLITNPNNRSPWNISFTPCDLSFRVIYYYHIRHMGVTPQPHAENIFPSTLLWLGFICMTKLRKLWLSLLWLNLLWKNSLSNLFTTGYWIREGSWKPSCSV